MRILTAYEQLIERIRDWGVELAKSELENDFSTLLRVECDSTYRYVKWINTLDEPERLYAMIAKVNEIFMSFPDNKNYPNERQLYYIKKCQIERNTKRIACAYIDPMAFSKPEIMRTKAMPITKSRIKEELKVELEDSNSSEFWFNETSGDWLFSTHIDLRAFRYRITHNIMVTRNDYCYDEKNEKLIICSAILTNINFPDIIGCRPSPYPANTRERLDHSLDVLIQLHKMVIGKFSELVLDLGISDPEPDDTPRLRLV